MVLVVAIFNSGVNHTVATGRGNAADAACVGFNAVAIITALEAIGTGLEIEPANTVAAARLRAVIAAGISVVSVTIITGFNTLLSLTVAAGSRDAITQTGIGIDLIAVITGFDAGASNAIAASR